MKNPPRKQKPKYVCGECGTGRVFAPFDICDGCKRKVRKELGTKGTPVDPRTSEIPF